MNTFMNAGTYVMNCKTGKAYMIATDTIQTRNRRQLTGKHKRSVKDRAVIRAWRELRAKMVA